jgi:hypothetical protein
MPPLNSFKLLGVIAFALLIFSACRFWQSATSGTPTPTPFTAEELKSEIPFSAKEPEIFQVEIVVTTNNLESKTFAARNGGNRRYDFDAGAKNQLSILQTDKNYLILPYKKVYAENSLAENFTASESWMDFLTTQWLNNKSDVKFFKLEPENNLARYRVSFGGTENSESLIFLDEAKNLIVKQEFYSVGDGGGGGQKTLTMTVELKNLKLEAEEGLFAVPKDYRKVSLEELREISQSENNE